MDLNFGTSGDLTTSPTIQLNKLNYFYYKKCIFPEFPETLQNLWKIEKPQFRASNFRLGLVIYVVDAIIQLS